MNPLRAGIRNFIVNTDKEIGLNFTVLSEAEIKSVISSYIKEH